jgi:hypothetical protein
VIQKMGLCAICEQMVWHMNGDTGMIKQPSHDVAGFDKVPEGRMQVMQQRWALSCCVHLRMSERIHEAPSIT